MKNTLIAVVLFTILLAFCKKKDNLPIVCPDRCPVGASCIEGNCICGGDEASKDKYRIINGKWCERVGAFTAYTEEWYCIDTFTVWINPPENEEPDNLPNTWARFINHRDYVAGFLGTNPVQQSVFYYRKAGGDSIYIPEVPLSRGNNRRLCEALGSTLENACFVDLHGKFVSPDTIKGFLRVRCEEGSKHPKHNERKSITLTRVK